MFMKYLSYVYYILFLIRFFSKFLLFFFLKKAIKNDMFELY